MTDNNKRKFLKKYYIISFVLFLISTVSVIAVASNVEGFVIPALFIGAISMSSFIVISLKLINKLKE